MSEVQKIPTAKFNPGYGCAIFAIMVLTFGGIVTWVVHSLMEQSRQIAGFTVEQAESLPLLNGSDDAKAALAQKLAAFAAAAKNGEGQLSLDAGECNLLLLLATDAGIGGEGESSPYPELLRFTGFDVAGRLVNAHLRLPMNKLPWQQGRRFLVGDASFRPDIDNGSLVVRIESISVPGKEVPEGFVRNLKVWDWLDVAKKKDSAISNALKQVTSWRISTDGTNLILESKPRAKQDDRP